MQQTMIAVSKKIEQPSGSGGNKYTQNKSANIRPNVRTTELSKMIEIVLNDPDSVTREEFLLFQSSIGYSKAVRLMEEGKRRKQQQKMGLTEPWVKNSTIPQDVKDDIIKVGKDKNTNPDYNWNTETGIYNGYVKEAQEMLETLCYKLPKYGVDGKWSKGGETYIALLQFQNNCKNTLKGIKQNGNAANQIQTGYLQGVEPTGKLDKPTYMALQAIETAKKVPDKSRQGTNKITSKPSGGQGDIKTKKTGNPSKWTPSSTLAKAVSTAGFLYDPNQDIIYSRMNALQRKFGYCKAYDVLAPIGLSTIIDCEPIYFTYDNKNWMIELWKGQYGMETGAEIGVYNRKSGKFDIRDGIMGKFFDSASDNDRLTLSFILKKNGTELIRRGPEVHWWLTGFKWGVFTENPSVDLTMAVDIMLKDSTMKKAFIQGLKGYTVTGSGNKVSFNFGVPKTQQTKSRIDNFDFVQANNKTFVDDYNLVKSYLELSSNDPNLIEESAIQTASSEVKAAYNEILGWLNNMLNVFKNTIKTK